MVVVVAVAVEEVNLHHKTSLTRFAVVVADVVDAVAAAKRPVNRRKLVSRSILKAIRLSFEQLRKTLKRFAISSRLLTTVVNRTKTPLLLTRPMAV